MIALERDFVRIHEEEKLVKIVGVFMS